MGLFEEKPQLATSALDIIWFVMCSDVVASCGFHCTLSGYFHGCWFEQAV